MGWTSRLAWLVALALAAAAPAHADPPSPVQRIALTAKPSVVRVMGAYIATYDLGGDKVQEAIGGSGTGFFITPDGYIATNAHVVSAIEGGDDDAKKQLEQELLGDIQKQYGAELAKLSASQIKTVLDSIKLVDLKKWAYIVLPNGDHLDYEIEEYGKPGTGRDCAIIKVKIDNAPTLPLGDSTKSQVEDHIVVIGYPGVADFKDLLDDKSQLEPSITDGAISALKHASTGEQILQISAPITHGNSGGPAIDQHGNVVGLATFGNEGDVQGFNFLVASDTLMDLVKDAKIKPRPSDTNKAWSAGLDHFWKDEYTDAIKNFEDVETLFPQHSDAQHLIIESHQAQKDGKEKKPPDQTGLYVGLGVGGALLVLVAGVLIVRRSRAMPRPGVPYVPGMMPPGAMPPGGHNMAPGMAPPGGHNMLPGMRPAMPGVMAAGPGAPPIGMPPPMGMPQQMYGRAPAPQPAMPQPVAKTVAIAASPSGSVPGIAPTAFGSLSIGSLTCTRGQLAGHRFALTATGIVVGRQPGVANVLVNDSRASGKHVWIGIDSGQLVAIDQGTTNGTYINDVARGRISRAELKDGDVVIVGEPDCLSLVVKLGS
jgi:S1-C subfamily serine protease